MLHRILIVVWLTALAAAGAAALLAGRGAPDDSRLLWAASGLGDRAALGAQLQPEPGRRPRPDHAPSGAGEDDAPPNGLALFSDYATTPRTYASRHAVVHYVTSGLSAPPLNDDDGDQVPDYVERVAEAADTAVEYYARRGFARIRPDSGGPDARPDLYVSRFAAGTFGVAIPEAEAEGGAFAAVANSLDPSPAEALGSLYGTVAHELFHLVQFSYFAPGSAVAIPAWTLEGSAAAMERRLHPELGDIVSTLQLRRWFAAPHRSITTQSYGAQLLWADLDRRYPRLLPAYLARLAARPARGEGAAELTDTFRRVAGKPFAPVFHTFALAAAAEHGNALTPVRSVSSGAVRGAVAPLAVHYVRLRLRRGGPATRVRVQPGAPAVRATLVYELESETAGELSEIVRAGRQVLANGATVFRIPESARRSTRFTRPVLVLSNGAPTRRAPYRLTVS
jgi:hypothetical protein